MDILGKIADSLGGGLVKTALDVAKTYFPPSMSDKEKSDAELAFLAIQKDAENKTNLVARDIQEMFESRIRDMEGTSSDLKAIPLIGPLVIFARGMQRPVWGFAVLWIDFMVFGGDWVLVKESSQETAFMILNLLVLGFLFGERAFQNVAPLIEKFMRK